MEKLIFLESLISHERHSLKKMRIDNQNVINYAEDIKYLNILTKTKLLISHTSPENV